MATKRETATRRAPRPAVTPKRVKAKAASRVTSPTVAAKAAKLLGDEGSTAEEKAVAASALAQAESPSVDVSTSTVGIDEYLNVNGLTAIGSETLQEMMDELKGARATVETLEAANVTLQAEVARLGETLKDAQEVTKNREATIASLRAQIERAAEAVPLDITTLQAEVTQLREQVKWHKEQGSTRRA